MKNKTIRFSSHAQLQMHLRGAEKEEVITAISNGEWELTKKDRNHCTYKFPFQKVSPMNDKFYNHKMLDVIFVEEEKFIEVITVKVYYFN